MHEAQQQQQQQQERDGWTDGRRRLYDAAARMTFLLPAPTNRPTDRRATPDARVRVFSRAAGDSTQRRRRRRRRRRRCVIYVTDYSCVGAVSVGRPATASDHHMTSLSSSTYLHYHGFLHSSRTCTQLVSLVGDERLPGAHCTTVVTFSRLLHRRFSSKSLQSPNHVNASQRKGQF